MFKADFCDWWQGLPCAFLPPLVYSISHPMVADGTMSVNGNTSSMKLNVVKSLHMITISAASLRLESLVVANTTLLPQHAVPVVVEMVHNERLHWCPSYVRNIASSRHNV